MEELEPERCCIQEPHNEVTDQERSTSSYQAKARIWVTLLSKLIYMNKWCKRIVNLFCASWLYKTAEVDESWKVWLTRYAADAKGGHMTALDHSEAFCEGAGRSAFHTQALNAFKAIETQLSLYSLWSLTLAFSCPLSQANQPLFSRLNSSSWSPSSGPALPSAKYPETSTPLCLACTSQDSLSCLPRESLLWARHVNPTLRHLTSAQA